MFKSKRHKRNILDMRDTNSVYPYNRFGENNSYHTYSYKDMPDKMPNKNNTTILNWLYPRENLITLFKIIEGQKMHKKDFTPDQIVFEPKILVYMIFLSEDEKLEEYLRCWKKYKPHIEMKIHEELITPNLRVFCSCIGCFGKCVRITMKYDVLPDVINNEMFSDFMNDD